MGNKHEGNPNIKIYVACHKEAYVPKNPYLYQIQVGTALSESRLEGILHDDEGDSISEKNKSYCELTAQYWAWKNDDADYYGLFHYRRYLSFDPDIKTDIFSNVVFNRINDEVINEIKLLPDAMRELITKYDIIVAKSRKYQEGDARRKETKLSVYEEYDISAAQHQRDLDIMLRVLKQKYPEFSEVADAYMESDTPYECNLFIMKREHYMDYCKWMFDILFDVEKQLDTTWYSIEEYRVMGFLAERLHGIYINYLKKKENVRYTELPRVILKDTEPSAELKPIFQSSIPIVLAANEKFAPYLDVMIRSIICHASPDRNYDIIILHNDITDRSKELIKSAAVKKENISIRFARVKEYFDETKLFVNNHLSVETYYRLIIPELMPDYHKVLYLDCDMIVERDVSELYDIELGDNLVAAAKDVDAAGQINLGNEKWKSYIIEDLGVAIPYNYFQAGVLIFNLDGLRKATSINKLLEMAQTHRYTYLDQDIMNIICKDRVVYLPQAWNVLMDWKEPNLSRMDIMKMAPRELYTEYIEARKNPYIVHYAGGQKPWIVADCDFSELFWKYARQSPWYELMIYNITRNTVEPSVVVTAYEPLWRRILAVPFPYGSRRRQLLKRILGIKS